MDDARIVGTPKTDAGLSRHLGSSVRVKRSYAAHPLLQLFAREELHGHVGPSGYAVGANVQDAADVAAVDLSGSACFPLEALDVVFFALEIGCPNDLYRDIAAGSEVACSIHLTHAARAQLAEDLVTVVQAPSQHGRHSLVGLWPRTKFKSPIIVAAG